MIHNYLSSAEGRKAICEFVITPKGRQAMKQVLPDILSCMSLPLDLQEKITQTLKEIPWGLSFLQHNCLFSLVMNYLEYRLMEKSRSRKYTIKNV
jgi:hypothetical protein